MYIGDLQYKTEIITGNGNTFVLIVGILVAGLVVSIIIRGCISFTEKEG